MTTTNYFIMRSSSDPKIIGVRDGGSQAKIDREKFSEKSNYDKFFDFFAKRDSTIWLKLDKVPSFDFELEYVGLRNGAKLTDFLVYYPEAFGANFLMSEKAIHVLEQHNLPIHKKYSAKVYYNERDFILYKLVYFPALGYDMVNFSKTIFYKGSEITGKEHFKINSPQEFELLRPKSAFDIEELVLTNSFDKKLDLFNTKTTYEFIISAKLKDAILKEKLTGINLIEAKGPTQMRIVIE
jgi:hypothetical protein